MVFSRSIDTSVVKYALHDIFSEVGRHVRETV